MFVTFMAFNGGTFVIAVDISVFLLTAVFHHHDLAIPAEQLGCENISLPCLILDRRSLVALHVCHRTFKKIFGNDGRNTARNDYIAVVVLTDICAVLDHVT